MDKINENSRKPIFIRAFFNEIELSTATGFLINYDHKYLVTNWHVVSGRNFITKKALDEKRAAIPNKLLVRLVKYIDAEHYIWVEKTIKLYDENENKLWYEHPKLGSDIDVVLIMLDEQGGYSTNKECFNFSTSYSVDVTENVFVLGFPLGFTIKSKDEPHAIWTSGCVASDPALGLRLDGIDAELPAFLIDSRTRPGQSGSPVIYYSQQGIDPHYTTPGGRYGTAVWGHPVMKEIGIYSGRIHKDSDLGVVWKWSVLKDFFDENNKQNK